MVMLIANPFLLVHDTGFQLSFLATLGLIVLAPLVERWLMRVPEGFFGFRTILTATIATQIMVLPLLLYHTGLLSLVTVVVNALVLPAVPVAMLLTFFTGILGPFSELVGTTLGFLAYLSLTYIIKVAEIFAAIPFSSVSISAFPFWIVPLVYLLLALWIKRVSAPPLLAPRSPEDLSGWTIEEEQQKPTAVPNSAVGSSLPRTP
jgi:competence protein ComEC